MRRSSLYISATLHALLILLAILGLPFITHKELDIPQPITVDLVQISQITQTNKPAPPQPQPPQPPQPKPPEPPKPQPAPPTPAPPVPTPPAPTPEPPKPEPKVEKPVPKIDENAPPKKEEKKVVKKEPPKKTAPPKSFASMMKQLDVKDKPAPVTEQAQQAPIGEKLTISEEDALKTQLMGCWNVPIGAKDVASVSVGIVMTINEDRTLKEAHIDDQARYYADPLYQALADSALRAVHNPNCSPFDVPPDKYDTWKTTTVNFNPKDMF